MTVLETKYVIRKLAKLAKLSNILGNRYGNVSFVKKYLFHNYVLFFISNIIISKSSVKLTKNLANAKQHPER